MSTPDTWLSVPEYAEELGCQQRDIRNMIADHRLIAVRRGPNNALAISTRTMVERDGERAVLPSLRGTLVSLSDAGLDDAEAWEWLTTVHEELGEEPLEALRAGKIHGVRRVATMLAW